MLEQDDKVCLVAFEGSVDLIFEHEKVIFPTVSAQIVTGVLHENVGNLLALKPAIGRAPQGYNNLGLRGPLLKEVEEMGSACILLLGRGSTISGRATAADVRNLEIVAQLENRNPLVQELAGPTHKG